MTFEHKDELIDLALDEIGLSSIRDIVFETNIEEVHGQRVLCELCGKPFCCLSSSEFTASAKGKSYKEQAAKNEWYGAVCDLLGNAIEGNQSSVALCPHCNQYPDWMVSDMKTEIRVGIGLLLGALLGVLGCIGTAIILFRSDSVDAWMTAIGGGGLGLVVGFVIGFVIGWGIGEFKTKHISNAAPDRDVPQHRAMTDERFLEFVQECEQAAVDPFAAWFKMNGNILQEDRNLASLGMIDDVGGLPLDKTLMPDWCLRAYSKALERRTNTWPDIQTIRSRIRQRRGTKKRTRHSGWFVRVGDKVLGPLKTDALKAMVRCGELTPESQLCRGGTDSWGPARRFRGLFDR